ncbi:hypothetical protein [Streptomyces sp. JHA26]|uniref:hypothetical protein n=1 Tax=Streptomyces sp. JHA26 TaxID=1917143 RepID=UPI0015C550AC|nr:hypothetical protein [Streptomyces sp. JHA26]
MLVVKAVVLGGGALAVYGVGRPTAAVDTAVAETFRRTRPEGGPAPGHHPAGA